MLPLFFLLMPPTVWGIVVTFFIYFTACLLLKKYHLIENYPKPFSDRKWDWIFVCSALLSLTLSIVFFNKWLPSSKVAMFAGIIHLPPEVFLLLVTILLFLFSIYEIYIFLTLALSEAEKEKNVVEISPNTDRAGKLYVTVVLILVMVLGGFWCTQKNGMFLDEIYSYGLSNGYYTPFLTTIKQGDIVDTTFSHKELVDYLTTSEEDAFSYNSVFYNQMKDVHPPLFYVVLHTVSSVFPKTFSKWIGLGLNLLYFLITLLLMNNLSKQLFHNRFISGLMIVLYGCTSYALSNVVFIRMYMLSTMLTVALASLVLQILKTDKWSNYILSCIVVCAGLLTHYFFVFYAFFISAFLVIYLLYQKEYKKAVKSSIFLVLGVIAFVAIFPTCLQHITAKTGGGTTSAEYISSFSFHRILGNAYELATGYIFPIVLGILLLFFLLINRKKVVAVFPTHKTSLPDFIILVGPALLSFFAITLVSNSSRYLANITPFFVFIVGYIIYTISYAIKNQLFKIVGLISITILSVFFGFSIQPSYLYPTYKDNDQMICECSDYSCVYITTNRNPSITQDLPQLIHFDNVAVVEDVDSPYFMSKLQTISQQNGLIVYFASYPDALFKEEIVSNISEKTGFSSSTFLYSNGWSDVYKFTRGA